MEQVIATEKSVTWAEVDAVPGWRESLRRRWYDLAGLPMPRTAQQGDTQDSRKGIQNGN